MTIRLSKSKLEKFKECPRCFYLAEKLGLARPEGIRAGVPMGIDRVLKEHYDRHRAAGTVPQEFAAGIPGGLYDGKRMSMADLRNWRKGLVATIDGVELSTAMDDLLYDPATKLYHVYDAKSKAKLTNEEDTAKYYQTQADAYDLALNENGYPTDGWAYFGYYSPVQVLPPKQSGPDVNFHWNFQVVKIKADNERVKALVRAAAACLNGPLPAPNFRVEAGKRGGTSVVGCETCAYVAAHEKVGGAAQEVA